MMKRTMVRYKVRAEAAASNEELVRGVFEELYALNPPGLRYQVLVLDDGLSYVHIAEHEDAGNPLLALPAFKRYTEAVRERCEEQPISTQARAIGQFGPSDLT